MAHRAVTGFVLAFVSSCIAAVPVVWGAPPATGPAPSFGGAREHFLRGEYEQADALYATLGERARGSVRAACGRAEIDLQLGRYADGLARLAALEDQGADRASRHAALAAILAEVGRYHEAVPHNRRALQLEPGHLRASWQLGQLFEALGRPDDALKAYAIFEKTMTEGSLPERAEGLTYLGMGFLRHSTLSRHANIVRRTRHVLREVYQDAFEFVDPLYWPARLAAAELLLEKHDLAEAKEDFERICEQNPRVPAAHVGLGRVALERWGLEEVEEQAEAALEVNPNFVPAQVLLADLRMVEGRYGDAAAVARDALKTNPNAIDALSVLAAAQLCNGDETASRATRQRIVKINPTPALLHHVLGVWLTAGRQSTAAELQFKKAIQYAPTWVQPRTELGLLHMETGDEAAARQILEEAFALDGFDQRTYNVLQLLDRLEKFARITTEHFVIKYDDEADAVVAPYFAEALEAMYADICGQFDARPRQATIVELFPDHLGFSRRIAHRPFIATVGACTGRVIALAAPRESTGFGPFNWKAVLRHEFVHTVTLHATENRIPRWLTEGLAVSAEAPPRSWGVKHLLTDAVRREELFTLERIDWGFVRPRKPGERGLAYAQSEWLVEYIVEHHGREAVLDLLKAFRENLKQAEAILRALKTDTGTLEERFGRWAFEQVEQWGLPSWIDETPDDVKALLEEDPDDGALLVRLAEAELRKGAFDDAESAARRALEQAPRQASVLEVLSRILMGRMLGERDEASRRVLIDQAELYVRQLHELDPDNAAGVRYLGCIAQSAERWDEAIRWLSQYQRRFPEDPDPARRMAAIHLRREDPGAALCELERLFGLAETEAVVAIQVASLYRDQGRHDLTAQWCRRAIEIDPYDVDTHAALADAYFEIGAYPEAEREYKVVCTLAPDITAGHDGLRRVSAARDRVIETDADKERSGSVGPRGGENVPDH